jgi:long-chain acyl-CoA synthetase
MGSEVAQSLEGGLVPLKYGHAAQDAIFPDGSIPGVFAVARADPHRVAIVEPDGTRVTFAELVASVDRVSAKLSKIGLKRGDVVAGLIDNCIEYFELILATFQSGMYYVPLNTRLSARDIEFIVRDCTARVLVAHSGYTRSLMPVVSSLPYARFAIGEPTPGWKNYGDFSAGGQAKPPAERFAGAVMGYTSGTTGRPKGVQRALHDISPEDSLALTFPFMQQFGLHTGMGPHLVCSPLYHAAPAGFSITCLHLGQTLVLHKRFDAEAVLRDIEQFDVASTHMVPTHFHRLLRLPRAMRESYDVSSLQVVLHAGAPCPVSTKKDMINWFGPIIWEYLASTEGPVSVISPEEWLMHPGSVGKPTSILLLDDDGAPVETGTEGTIYFPAGPMAFSYHNNPDMTAAARHGDFVTVGDIGTLDETGYLYLLDRRSDLIISGGVNIYPAEIEQFYMDHPAVSDIAVIGLPDEEWGQSVLAVIQPVDTVPADDDLRRSLFDFAAEGLASHKRPRRIEFEQTLPRTDAGKLMRREVRDAYMPQVRSVHPR